MEGRKEEGARKRKGKCYLVLVPKTSGLKMSALSAISYVVLGMPFNLPESHL